MSSRMRTPSRRAPPIAPVLPLAQPRVPATRVITGATDRTPTQTGSMRCTHVDTVRVTELPARVEGCAECLQAGTPWLHLRICLECGQVGCCDSSPAHHASGHARASGHPLIRSIEPGETWAWCFIDDVGLQIPEVHGETRIPPSPLQGSA